MFNIFFRRLQKFLGIIRVGILVSGVGILGFLVMNVVPSVMSITIFSLLLGVVVFLGLSFMISGATALIMALGLSIIVFLKAVSLLTIENLVMVGLLMGLLSLYFKKR